MRRKIAYIVFGIANTINIFIAVLSAYLFSTDIVGGLEVSGVRILFLLIQFVIAGVAWFALYRIVAGKQTKWMLFFLVPLLIHVSDLYSLLKGAWIGYGGQLPLELLLTMWPFILMFLAPVVLYSFAYVLMWVGRDKVPNG